MNDEDLNASASTRFGDVLDARLSRRSLLRGGIGTAASALPGGVTWPAWAAAARWPPRPGSRTWNLPVPPYACVLGFDLHEPGYIGNVISFGCGSACVDSTFTIEARMFDPVVGMRLITRFDYNAPNDNDLLHPPLTAARRSRTG